MNAVLPYKAAIDAVEQTFTEIAVADGNLVSFQKEAMFAFQIISASEYLQRCSPESIRNAVINVASIGLTLSPALKLAYLIPRKGKCILDISYIGLVKLATDSKAVAAVKAEVVCANDDFQYEGPFQMPHHRFNPFSNSADRGEVIGVYSVAKMQDGSLMIETMRREEIDKIRAKSEAKSGPWFDWFEEMVKKAIIKRASKMWPRTERLSNAEHLLNKQDGFIEDHTTITPTSGAAERMTPEQAEKVKAIVAKMKEWLDAGSIEDAVLEKENAELDADETVYLWTHFDSKQRSAMKKEFARMLEAQKGASTLSARIAACKTAEEVKAMKPEIAKLPQGKEREEVIAIATAMIEELEMSVAQEAS